MKLIRFADYLEQRLAEEATANAAAMRFDSTRQQIMNRFDGMPMEKQLEIIRSAGFENHRDFAIALQKNPNLFQKVKIPGQGNYIGR
jgi:hypothetical protein